MTSESKTHLKLKEVAKNILLKVGFKEKEIFYEYSVMIGVGRYYYVDIVGVNKKKKVFIECGRMINHNKLYILKQFCDKVIWLPYIPGSKVGPALGNKVHIYDLVKALNDVRKSTTPEFKPFRKTIT